MHSSLLAAAAMLGLSASLDHREPEHDDRFVGKAPKYRKRAPKHDDSRAKAKAARRANNRRKSK